jgi:hypothetical protein
LGYLPPLAAVIAPSGLRSVLGRVRLVLGQPLVQGLPSRRLRGGGPEPARASVSITGVPGVVARAIQHRVFGAVALKKFAGVIASGHVRPRS